MFAATLRRLLRLEAAEEGQVQKKRSLGQNAGGGGGGEDSLATVMAGVQFLGDSREQRLGH